MQFTLTQKIVVNHLQRTSAPEGYLVVETVQTGKQQIIALSLPVDPHAADKADLEIIREKNIEAVAKRRHKLEELLKKGYATVYDQCLQEVRNKLESVDNWDRIQQEQSLHEPITKIKKICLGFNDHKQEVFNLVQSLKTLFLYMQSKKDMVKEYGQNFRSLWDTVEAFGGLLGIHKGLMDSILETVVGIGGTVMTTQIKTAEEQSRKAVKAALLISRADRCRYGNLKDQLADNYLLGTNKYPNTLDKALRILGNYQTTRVAGGFKANPNDTGVAFLQQGGRGSPGTG